MRHRRRFGRPRPLPINLPASFVYGQVALTTVEFRRGMLFRRNNSPSLLVRPPAIPFDFPNAMRVGLFPMSTETFILSQFQPEAGTPGPGPVPPETRMLIDEIDTWASDWFGRPLPLKLFLALPPNGSSVSVQWKFYVDNRLALLHIIPSNMGVSIVAPRPLLELAPGQTLTATITRLNDPAAQVAFLGVRVRGRFVPFDEKDYQ